jgi:hypothetical protein
MGSIAAERKINALIAGFFEVNEEPCAIRDAVRLLLSARRHGGRSEQNQEQ